MGGRYGAFTFCDRITEYVPARRARATFAVPPTLSQFSPCLVAEATGQLAAWVSMAHIGFRGRPVAALARDVRMLGDVHPGETLTLEVDIEECDDDAVFYQGRAHVGGRDVVQLDRLPRADAAAGRLRFGRRPRARNSRCCAARAQPPARFDGVGAHAMESIAATDDSRSARLHVPVDAPYFVDHFPRRPVFPATLLLDHAMRVAADLVDCRCAAGRNACRACTNVKMRDFIRPGEDVMLQRDASRRRRRRRRA